MKSFAFSGTYRVRLTRYSVPIVCIRNSQASPRPKCSACLAKVNLCLSRQKLGPASKQYHNDQHKLIFKVLETLRQQSHLQCLQIMSATTLLLADKLLCNTTWTVLCNTTWRSVAVELVWHASMHQSGRRALGKRCKFSNLVLCEMSISGMQAGRAWLAFDHLGWGGFPGIVGRSVECKQYLAVLSDTIYELSLLQKRYTDQAHLLVFQPHRNLGLRILPWSWGRWQFCVSILEWPRRLQPSAKVES